jgi:hypothetical protein
MHSHQRMFWTRCCTTCHTPSQLFQAFYGNITTSETHETSPGVGEISAGTCDVARIGTQPTHAQPPAHVLNPLLHHLPHPITAVSSILQQHKHIRNTGNQSWIGLNFLQGLIMRHALVPDLLLHSQQRMFWTRCCTTCHITSQLFQALYSNIKTSKTKKNQSQNGVNFL